MEARDQIVARLYVLLTLLCLGPLLIAVQVVRLGVLDGQSLREQGEKQSSAYVDIPALRGSILDRTGRTLAVDVARYEIAVDPTVSDFSPSRRVFFERLSRLTGRSRSELRSRMRRPRSPRYVVLVRSAQLDNEQLETARRMSGVIITPRFGRRYNYDGVAAAILGHVGADMHGLGGLEKEYDSLMHGSPGRRSARRDRRGVRKVVAGGAVVPPQYGETLVLTIDVVRQTILEEELRRGVLDAGARWGTAIAVAPRTGEIMAMANYPSYDPNRPAASDDFARRNHAITDRYEPGSTFKLVAGAAAIETGLVEMGDSIDTDPGWIVRYGRRVSDTHPHGKITFSEVISLSSNVGFDLVVEKLDHGVFYQYARRLGFGSPTRMDLPGEVGGRVKRVSEWSGPTLSAMSRGYEVEVTPLQMLMAYSALATRGILMKPYVVAERRNVTGQTTWRAHPVPIRRAFSEETAQTLIPAFEEVVNSGTAKNASISGVRVAGKTGTARKTKNGRYSTGAYRATFVGFFPVESPEVAMIVMMDEPASSIYGGSVAAPVFQRTAKRWLATLPSIHRTTADTTRSDATTNDPVGAVSRTHNSLLTDQHARSFNNGDQKGMPDLIGVSIREASFVLAGRGVHARFKGHGRVVEQWPRPGEPLPGEAIFQCR